MKKLTTVVLIFTLLLSFSVSAVIDPSNVVESSDEPIFHVSRQGVTEECFECLSEKQWHITQLTTVDGEVVSRRRAAKRDSGGNLLEPCRESYYITPQLVEICDDCGEEECMCPDVEICSSEFLLTISVEETTLTQGENFQVNVELKNNSGQDVEITYSLLFWPHIVGMPNIDGMVITPPHLRTVLFEAGNVLANTGMGSGLLEEGVRKSEPCSFVGTPWEFGHSLEPGSYELHFVASFIINSGRDGEQSVSIRSNMVLITVTPHPLHHLISPGVVEVTLQETYTGKSLVDLLGDFFDEFEVVAVDVWPSRNVDKNDTERVSEEIRIWLLHENREIVIDAIEFLSQNPYIREAMPLYVRVPHLP